MADAQIASCGTPRCLVITPIPTVPANQGNAVNIARLNHCIRAAGYHLHMVYSAMEGADDWQVKGMGADCDGLEVLPHRVNIPPPTPCGYELDSWYDPAVGAHVAALCERQRFDIAVVHYAWMSKVLEAIGPTTRRILFTHDRFGERHALLAAAGIAPTWYSISTDDEARALDRADVVLAVQDDEAAYFRSICRSPVHVLGSIQALRRRPKLLPDPRARLRIGYLGSANPGNVRSLESMIAAIEMQCGDPGDHIELVIAGPISTERRFARSWITAMGFVDRPEVLYQRVEVMCNPSEGGSGLKIKSVECLAAGMPLVATRDAMAGIPATHPALACDGAFEVAQWLLRMHASGALEELAAATMAAIQQYCASQVASFLDLFGRHTGRA